eukprot:TRINITY_DN20171_c0_g1_i1.p1 TRINITY_DN20171_c0_g1~~TRINITY_DN20171_c0_g1_i1.p1  ORF type:complete len:142 (+),score=22.61 TRINITY_DN20171_c0_g1_i1:11-436(+)
MLTYEQLQRHYELQSKEKIICRPRIEVIRTTRKEQPIDERVKYQEVAVKTVRDIEVRIDRPETMIEDLKKIMRGPLAYYRAKSDLTVNIEGVCFVPNKLDDEEEDVQIHEERKQYDAKKSVLHQPDYSNGVLWLRSNGADE